MSRLKRKKKNHHPPFEEPSPNYEKDGDGTKNVNLMESSVQKLETSIPKIFKRAIASAQKHHIRLEPGIENQGHGNCSYESVIYNINERSCFTEKLIMSSDYYRRIWNIDMLNKILDQRIPWNPGLSRAELIEGFTELLESGVYERPFFGDMMMASIACGVRKRILIFNTNEKSYHDPVAVVDPEMYGGYVDSEIPVVVAYDMVHFESLHPVESKDIEETVKLVKSYIAKPSRYQQEYGFTRKDMIYLISKDNIDTPQEISSKRESCSTVSLGECEAGGIEHQMQNVRPQTELLELHKQEIEKGSVRVRPECEEKEPEIEVTKSKIEETVLQQEQNEMFEFEGFCFRELQTGKIVCGMCQAESIRLMHHMNKSTDCNKHLNLKKFKEEYEKYKARQRKKRQENKNKSEDPDMFKQNAKKRIAKHEAKKKDDSALCAVLASGRS